MSSFKLKSCDELALRRLAMQLAAILKKGDIIYLKGTLGAGKTTFAREMIQTLSNNPDQEVLSPTFPLLINYTTDRFPISHYDLYRLGDVSELEELGIYDERETNLILVEWPEKLPEQDFENRIEIELTESDAGETRDISITGVGESAVKVARFQALKKFIAETEWKEAEWRFLDGDASSRSYIRLTKGDNKSLLMNAPPKPDGPPIRDGKPYSEIAYLAEDMTSFVTIASALEQTGLKVPTVSHHDVSQGFLIIKDLGNAQFFNLIHQGKKSHQELAEKAIDVLVHLYAFKPGIMSVDHLTYQLPQYDNEALAIEAELLIDWYWPKVKSATIDDQNQKHFTELWQSLFTHLSSDNEHWVLRDYHSPNLMLLTGDTPIEQVGIIDFQDAVKGHAAYDVVSLCQDARLTVNEQLELSLKGRYIENLQKGHPNFDQDDFNRAYAILGAQRMCKIIGIFIRLAERDGKTGYLTHLPRCWDYLERNLRHPDLKELKSWLDNQFPTNLRAAYWDNKQSKAI